MERRFRDGKVKQNFENRKSLGVDRHYFPKNKISDSPLATFPIAIGPKNESHDELEGLIALDFKKMSSSRIPAFMGYHNGFLPEEITFSAEMFLSLGDQPERRGGNCLLAGNSKSHRRWRYCCDISQLRNVFPACQECVESMKAADSELSTTAMRRECNHCTNWMLCNLDSPLLRYDVAASFPKGYVLGGLQAPPDYQGRVSPILLDYEQLKDIIITTHNNICAQKWTPNESLTYLGANGISRKYAKKVVKNAKNCLKHRIAFENREKEEEEYLEVDLQKQKHPMDFEMAKIPSVWDRDVPLNLYVDTPMHLLFLGIAKTVFWYVGLWCSRSGRGDAFLKAGSLRLASLDRLKLQWLSFNVSTFMTWKGWVSEKYQSLTRVALWVYGPLMTIDEMKPFEEPKPTLLLTVGPLPTTGSGWRFVVYHRKDTNLT